MTVGDEMHRWASDLFRFPRSLTGDGVRDTLRYLASLVPGLVLHEVPSGTQVFDWTVPDEWNLRRAWIEDESGAKIVDTNVHNLHVLGYSEPIDEWMDLSELDGHLHSLPDQPDAIPYVTSYYAPRWGFCISENQRRSLREGRYRAVVDAQKGPGSLTYADLVLPGESADEILFSTYVCHPMMANNELSGPVVVTALARELSKREGRRFTYRFVFIPETIGAIAYLSANLAQLKEHVRAGWVVTCVGDEGDYSFLPSRSGTSLADRLADHVLRHKTDSFTKYSFLDRGSDERQYCAPGIDLPVASVMRTKYGQFPEYHTSLDDLTFVTPAGLEGALGVYREIISILERNAVYSPAVLCEPQLGKRGLYPTLSTKTSAVQVRDMMNVIAFTDGALDTLEIADLLNLYAGDVQDLSEKLAGAGVLERS